MAASLFRIVAVPAAVILGTGCILLASLSASTTTAPLDRRNHRALRLMPKMEIIRYDARDPRTVGGKRIRKRGKDASWWNDIDYYQRGMCGKKKCFFVSLRDPSKGYLIGHTNLDKTMQAYRYASELESKYGARQFSTDPPFEETAPAYFQQHLHGEYTSFYKNAESLALVIQPTRTAPEGSVVFRCYNPRVSIGRLNYILRCMDQESKQGLMGELENTIRVVENQPELITDFHLIIDRQGLVWHLDLDRVRVGEVKKKPTRLYRGCLEGAVEHVRKQLNRGPKNTCYGRL